MTRPPPNQNWLPYAGLIVTIAGIIYTSGQLTNKVQSNTDRIAKLEVSDTVRSDSVNSTNVRLARIETKLELLLAEQERQRGDKR